MPHIIIKMFPGRTEGQKKNLADKVSKAVMETLEVGEETVSVAFFEIPREKWGKEVYKPDIIDGKKSLYINPGYSMTEGEFD